MNLNQREFRARARACHGHVVILRHVESTRVRGIRAAKRTRPSLLNLLCIGYRHLEKEARLAGPDVRLIKENGRRQSDPNQSVPRFQSTLTRCRRNFGTIQVGQFCHSPRKLLRFITRPLRPLSLSFFLCPYPLEPGREAGGEGGGSVRCLCFLPDTVRA